MSTVIVADAAGWLGSENVKQIAREGFQVAKRRKLIKPV
jgi:nucleoside-diphosphate-sugar epimerase